MGSSQVLSLTGSLSLDLFVFGLSLLISGFFSSSETALTALSETKARQLIEKAPRRNAALQLWLTRPNRVLTTILIGNNVVNTFTASLATLLAQQILSRPGISERLGVGVDQALSIAVGVTTFALLVAGEITPKTFAKHNAERVAPIAMNLIRFIYWGLLPIVIVFTWMSKQLVKLSGGDVTRSGPFVTEEDIAYMVQLGQKEGVIEEHEEQLISSVLDFGDTVVKEIMIPRTAISGIPSTASLPEVLEVVREDGHTRMPVYGDNIDDVKGFFHSKELLRVLPDGSQDFSLVEHIKEPFFVPELMKISELLREFQRRKTHLAVVVDEYGGTSGIVCLEDIIEEIVGEIQDEYDEEPEEFRRIDDDRYVAVGRANIYELGEALGVEFRQEDPYETLGGFLISEFGKMPSAGTRIAYQGWLFVVTDAEQRKVSRVEIVRISPSETSSPSLPKPKLTVVGS